MIMLIVSPVIQAEENLWVYTQGTDTRPKGSFEVKFNNISRLDKDSGDYSFHDMRPQIEYGVTDKLTVAGSIILFHHDYDGIEVGNDPVHETQEANGGSVSEFNYGGFQLFTKYNILSPYKDWMGLSIGIGYEKRNRYRLDGAKINQDSYTPQLFLQKNFLDDTLVVAFRGIMEFERRKSGGDTVLEEEIAFDVSMGISYRFAPKWFVGFEFRSQSDYLCVQENGVQESGKHCSSWDFSNPKLGSQFQHGEYIGPSIHYGEERWYVTTGVLYQIVGGGAKESFSRDGKNYDEHEKWHLGFSVGYNF